MDTTKTIRRVPIVTGIIAGRGIPDESMDWAITGFRDIRIEPANQFDKLIAVPVEGDSLNALGIFHGDFLITRLSEEYQEGKLAVWQTPHGRAAKFAEVDDDSVLLHNKNGWSERWAISELRLLGTVIRIERDMA